MESNSMSFKQLQSFLSISGESREIEYKFFLKLSEPKQIIITKYWYWERNLEIDKVVLTKQLTSKINELVLWTHSNLRIQT